MEENYKGKVLVDAGASIVGATAGGAVGALIGTAMAGPGSGTVVGATLGAAAGGTVSETLKRALADMTSRVFSRREQIRVGAAIDFAAVKIKQRLDAGDKLRDDNFFIEDKTDRSSADEIFEGVLLKSKNESEEKKVKFIGNLFANLAFRPEISITIANYFLKIIEGLTYRQLCFLGLLAKQGTLDIEKLRKYKGSLSEVNVLKREATSLFVSDFEDTGLIQPERGFAVTLSETGKVFYELLSLNEIPSTDLDEVQCLLKL